ncbi:O-antigen polysaccharide polymerase Wzy family protein [uncultured Fusobacterium sp.]|uniref:O-antigen polysaccharide polymerase Wzy family protein n=1 Tax=uncultured Fusobacterium sp. TaxID=159267 RepID=UPI00280644EE|nr:O-antigen polysaccharide polymerase Wzy family protein [uncultured Fusobacterium sp.]
MNFFSIRKIPGEIFIVILIFTIFFFLGNLFDMRWLLIMGLLGIFLFLFFILKKESYFATAFLISFFTFLLGRIIVNSFTGEKSLIYGSFIYDGPSDERLFNTLGLLLFSMITFGIGALCVPKTRFSIKFDKEKKNRLLEKSCITMFYITIIFSIIVSLERFIFVYRGGSYVNYYLFFSRILPSFIYKIAELNTPAFFSVLAFLPEKKKIKPIVIFYLFNAFIILLSGQRNSFVRAILFSFCYILLRNKNDKKEHWLSKTQFKLIIFILPIGIMCLQAWGVIRNGTSFNTTGIFEPIISFFRDQGTTSVVVYEGIELQNEFPIGINYTFAPIINFLKNNQITRLFYHFPVYAQQTVDLALYGNNFGATLTYLYKPHNYLIGIGMGSCYISELFHDFGWLGVGVINILYGILLVSTERYLSKTKKLPWLGMILLLFIDEILYSPRSSALDFLTNGINFTVIFYIFITYILTIFIGKRRSL